MRAANRSIEFSCILEMRETHIRKRMGFFRPPSSYSICATKPVHRAASRRTARRRIPNGFQGPSLTATMTATYHHARQHSRIRTEPVSWKIPKTKSFVYCIAPQQKCNLAEFPIHQREYSVRGNTVTCCFMSELWSRCGNCISFMRGATFMGISHVWWLESAV